VESGRKDDSAESRGAGGSAESLRAAPATQNVNGGWVGDGRVVNAARQHFVDLATFPPATSTFFPYSQHFVDVAKIRMTKSTKCCLIAAGSPAPVPSRS
jgi:hypothetical protein